MAANNGIGLVICVPEEFASSCIEQLEKLGETAWKIGFIEKNNE